MRSLSRSSWCTQAVLVDGHLNKASKAFATWQLYALLLAVLLLSTACLLDAAGVPTICVLRYRR